MDFSSPAAITRLILPKVPTLFMAAIYHTLNLSPTASKWDLKMELIVRLIRSLMETTKPMSVLRQQRGSMRDPGIKGKMWISKITLPAVPNSDVLDILCDSIDQLKETGDEKYVRPPILPVEAEWTGYRANADKNSPRPDLPENEHYANLMAEVKSPATALYIHGGALILMDPATHRLPCANLARRTGGRCFNVRYRLAPQHPFPAALLDVFTAYLSLLYPPPGSYHSPVPASQIVFAGDSAGGTLSFALLQLLLHIQRTFSSSEGGKSFRFHDQDVSLPIPLPAGVATNSAWLDLTNSMPSNFGNYQTDYLPHPVAVLTHFPADSIWPTDPPRGDLYCETSMLCHPLASPVAAHSWQGACPMFLWVGEEMLSDENKIVAARAASQGVAVRWMQSEAMPHCAGMIFQEGDLGKLVFGEWSRFISAAVDAATTAINSSSSSSTTDNHDRGKLAAKTTVCMETKGSFFAVKTFDETNVNVSRLDREVFPDCKDDGNSAIHDNSNNATEAIEQKIKTLMKESQRKRDIGAETETKVMPKL